VADAGHQYVHGLHAVRALLARRPDAIAGAKVLKESSPALEALAGELRRLGVRVERVPRVELDRLTGGGVHQGVLVEVHAAREFLLEDFEALVVARGRELRLLILDGVQDPRNLGACLRTADAAGVDALVVPKAHSAKLTPAAIKTATGAAEMVPVLRATNLARTIRWLKDAGVWVVGADAQAELSLYQAGLVPPVAIVLGGEGRGLRRLTRELCDERVAIPMRTGAVASLNVSVAAGVVLFELVRRTGAAP
jgi:23S rRNA (guanosine2251-2'-O)-methyltransferase